MRATGIIRRIDELGRIVIPKEIRKTFKIREGTPLEIFCGDECELILKKYSVMLEIKDYANDVAYSISTCLNLPCLITDKDKVVSVCGTQKNYYIDKVLTENLIRQIETRNLILRNKKDNDIMFKLFENDETEYASFAIMPVMQNGDTFGSIIVFSNEKKLTEVEAKVLQTMANFLSQQIA